jgi:hypothetical protein
MRTYNSYCLEISKPVTSSLTREPGRLKPFGSGSAVWQRTLLRLPGQNIRCRHATVSLENAVLFTTFFTVTSYSRKVSHSHIVSDRSGGSVLLLTMRPARVHMAMEA